MFTEEDEAALRIEERLHKLGVSLPEPGGSLGAYLPALVWDGYLYTSGQLPLVEGELAWRGKVGAEVGVEDAKSAARACAVNALALAKDVLGDLDRIKRVVKITGYVQSALGFSSQPEVLNGASEFLQAALGDDGRGVRSAVGVAELPLNAPVEIEFVFAV